ncbi:helix-turn-helix transcriptional regulator, partial [Acinetobacter baumannii]|nr:helix-turn-helix transcriptional regulator [Acinetobacter baumannii]
MVIELVKHSPNALRRYMTDMNVSASALANLTKISQSKINKALDEVEVFKLSQLETISKVLFVPTVYL